MYAARVTAIPSLIRAAVAVGAAVLVVFIALPLAALVAHLPPQRVATALATPGALAALRLSGITTACSLALTLLFGTPLAYALARGRFPGRAVVDAIVDLPIVVPPAVAGLALLFVFGRAGWFGPLLGAAHVQIAFTTAAVVLAQLFVGAPFYVRAARAGFASVDRVYEEASATLGMGPLRTFARVTVPLALPALAGGAVLAWARALGEFGATIMFAGNLPGVTQTLPLAVYLGLESGDVDLAAALAVVLVTIALAVVAAARLLERRAA
jgi:molybdate transport system permease protein